MRIAAIYPYDPTTPARIRSLDTLLTLKQAGQVTVFAPDLDPDALHRLELLGLAVHTRKDSALKRAMRVAFAMLRGRSITYAFYATVAPGETELGNFDLLYVERLTPPWRKTEAAVVYDVVDDFQRQVQQLSRTAAAPRRYGYLYDRLVIHRDILQACARADLVLCTTPAEARSIAAIGIASSKLLPYLHQSQVRVPALLPTETPQRRRTRRGVFHGRASYPANQAAVQVIESNLGPALEGWEFLVFGEGWKPSQGESIEVRGFQQDLRLLRSADAGIFPIEASVGVQNKVLECLAAGLPVVVTPGIAAGLPPPVVEALRERILVREVGDFAEALRNDGSKLSLSEAAERRFAQAYQKIIEQHRQQFTQRLQALGSGRDSACAAGAPSPS